MKMIAITSLVGIGAAVVGCTGQGLPGADGADGGTPQTGAYLVTVSKLAENCTPSVDPPSNVTVRIDGSRAPNLALDVPLRAWGMAPLGGYDLSIVTLSGSETYFESETACGERLGTHYTITAATDHSLDLDEEQTWSGVTGGACTVAVPTSACTLSGHIRYDLTLPCALPCKLVSPSSTPVGAPPFTCDCS